MTRGFNLFTKQCHYTTIFCNLCCAQAFWPLLSNSTKCLGKAVFVPSPCGLSPAETWQSPQGLLQRRDELRILSHTEYTELRSMQILKLLFLRLPRAAWEWTMRWVWEGACLQGQGPLNGDLEKGEEAAAARSSHEAEGTVCTWITSAVKWRHAGTFHWRDWTSQIRHWTGCQAP